MATIVRSIRAAYLLGSAKWHDVKRLAFDLDASVTKETAEAYLALTHPKGLVVSVPVKRGPQGGFGTKARFFRSSEPLYPMYPKNRDSVTWHVVEREVLKKNEEQAHKVAGVCLIPPDWA